VGMTDKEAMVKALEALEQMKAKANFECWNLDVCDEAIAALKERLAQRTEQEPVAWLVEFENGEQELHFDEQSVGEIHTPLYSIPPQRTWAGLTDKVITKVVESMPRGIKGWMSDWDLYDYARAIEAKLKEKNT